MGRAENEKIKMGTYVHSKEPSKLNTTNVATKVASVELDLFDRLVGGFPCVRYRGAHSCDSYDPSACCHDAVFGALRPGMKNRNARCFFCAVQTRNALSCFV